MLVFFPFHYDWNKSSQKPNVAHHSLSLGTCHQERATFKFCKPPISLTYISVMDREQSFAIKKTEQKAKFGVPEHFSTHSVKTPSSSEDLSVWKIKIAILRSQRLHQTCVVLDQQ